MVEGKGVFPATDFAPPPGVPEACRPCVPVVEVFPGEGEKFDANFPWTTMSGRHRARMGSPRRVVVVVVSDWRLEIGDWARKLKSAYEIRSRWVSPRPQPSILPFPFWMVRDRFDHDDISWPPQTTTSRDAPAGDLATSPCFLFSFSLVAASRLLVSQPNTPLLFYLRAPLDVTRPCWPLFALRSSLSAVRFALVCVRVCVCDRLVDCELA